MENLEGSMKKPTSVPEVAAPQDIDARSASEVLAELGQRRETLRTMLHETMKSAEKRRPEDDEQTDRKRRAVHAVAHADYYSRELELIGSGTVSEGESVIARFEKKYSNTPEGRAILDTEMQAKVSKLETADAELAGIEKDATALLKNAQNIYERMRAGNFGSDDWARVVKSIEKAGSNTGLNLEK